MLKWRMVVENIIQIGNPILRQKNELVKSVKDKKVLETIENLVDTMRSFGMVGTAAPQIGTNLKIFVTTSVPKTCYDDYELFCRLLEIVDGINLSVQHYKEDIADEIRKTKSQYNRQEFYNSLPHKDKIRINLNIVKPYLYTKEDITNCLNHYDKMGFNSIKISEITEEEIKNIIGEAYVGDQSQTNEQV